MPGHPFSLLLSLLLSAFLYAYKSFYCPASMQEPIPIPTAEGLFLSAQISLRISEARLNCIPIPTLPVPLFQMLLVWEPLYIKDLFCFTGDTSTLCK